MPSSLRNAVSVALFLALALPSLVSATTKSASKKSASVVSAKGSSAHPKASGTKSRKSAKSRTSSKRRLARSRSRKSRGQRSIDSQRAREIQEALIREGYLSGEPSGVWDSASQQAMARFQADNGWQDKIVPDSRALIKLGLGPDHSAVINPESLQSSINSAPVAHGQD